MANITLLHWNIETYGPAKYFNANNANFVNYIARLVLNVNADIFAMVEVKNSTSLVVPPIISTAICALQGLLFDPWRSVRVNSGYNNEAYIIMYRTDRNFLPIDNALNTGANIIPDNGLGMDNVAGNRINFPSRHTAKGGRRPFYVTFETTDTNQRFSVISYHAMFGVATPYGIIRLPDLNYITEFDDGTPIDASLISGDFNVDYNIDFAYYANMLALPTEEATNDNTSLKNNPLGGNDPATFLANAYDNIFQTVITGMTPTGDVTNLMIESAVVNGPQPPPPAAQPHVGNLSAEAGAFNIAALNNYLARIANPIVALPPVDMDTAWDFVREGISNHYPVAVTVTI
ncbi:hypothetical protein [Mucilaginibacter flavidus]|uniref:hypothetical protein n=1 Tax=Mucilaginibacter flavidus TaxID=2949309 RepID=UPI0020923265|nr:hypothetical protein [Mucilaginibacter flavidus]MCO5950980.1 hypothetical protein [Mucilaginibacter flavidus]